MLKLLKPRRGQPGHGQKAMLLVIPMGGTARLGSPPHGDEVLRRLGNLSGLISGTVIGGEDVLHGIHYLMRTGRRRLQRRLIAGATRARRSWARM